MTPARTAKKSPAGETFFTLCAIQDSNLWPTPRQGVALPTELTAHNSNIQKISNKYKYLV